MKIRHIIAIGLLSATAIGLLAIGNKPDKKPKTQTKAEVQITNLTDSIWYFNETPTPTTTVEEYTINYKANETEFTKLGLVKTIFFSIEAYGGIGQPQRTLYSAISGWTNQNNRTIEITGGTDATNTTLINYLYTNATLVNALDMAYKEGYTEGHIDGETVGFDYGYTAGETAGYNTGYSAGETAGYNTGYSAGETAGYNTGYGIGYADAGTYNEVVDIRGIMLQILTMPFTFLTQAFNVTLWEGTDYEFNVSNFIKGLIAIATILFIIKLFTTGFSIIGNYNSNRQQTKLTKSQIKLNKAKTEKIKKDTK